MICVPNVPWLSPGTDTFTVTGKLLLMDTLLIEPTDTPSAVQLMLEMTVSVSPPLCGGELNPTPLTKNVTCPTTGEDVNQPFSPVADGNEAEADPAASPRPKAAAALSLIELDRQPVDAVSEQDGRDRVAGFMDREPQGRKLKLG